MLRSGWLAHRLSIAFYGLILISITLGLGCGSSNDTIKVGAIMPLTGDGAKYGEAARNGIELALKAINTSGGIDGKSITVTYEDSQGDPRQGVAVARRLIDVERVNCIIGGLFSSVTLAVAPLMNENKVVLLSPTSSAPKITDAGDYIFRNVASDIFEGSVMAKYAADTLHYKKIAILYINNEYGAGISRVFRQKYEEMGGEVVIEESYEQDTQDFRAQLSKVKAANPDATYIVGYNELGQLLKQAKEIGLKTRFLSTVMFEDPDILNVAGGAAEGVIYSSRAYDPNSSAENVSEFVDAFKAAYGQEPDIFAALSFDAMNILALAMKDGGTTADGVKLALYNIKNYPGVVGTTSFDQNGDVVQEALIKTVKDGEFMPLDSN